MNFQDGCNSRGLHSRFHTGIASDQRQIHHRERHTPPGLMTENIVSEKGDGAHQLDEISQSAASLTRRYYNDFSISSCNHCKELIDKYQKLEVKMLEVEKCFKDANRLEMESEKHIGDTATPFTLASSYTSNDNSSGFQKPNKVVIGDTRKTSDEYDAHMFEVSNGNHCMNMTNISDAGGDNEAVKDSEMNGSLQPVLKDSDQSTVIMSTDKPSFTPSNRGSNSKTKSFLTMRFPTGHQEFRNHLSFEEDSKLADVDLLEKSKKLILGLIDKELAKIEGKSNQSSVVLNVGSNKNHRHLKRECIQNIERELETLKKLDSLDL